MSQLLSYTGLGKVATWFLDKAPREYNSLIMLILLQQMSDMPMGGFGVLGFVLALLLLLLCVLCALIPFSVFGIKPKLDRVIEGQQTLSADLKRLEQQLLKTPED